MAEYTKNYNLEKQQDSDYISIEGLNNNFDVIDEELNKLEEANVKAEAGKGLSSNDFTDAEKSKLAGVAANANNYVHPANHSASVIVQDANNRFVTDAEKGAWNGKASTNSPVLYGKTIFSRSDGTNAYNNGNIEIQGHNNTPPLIGFHRTGVSAVALFESGSRLFTTNNADLTPRKVMQENDFIFQTTVPTSLPNGTICFVYE